MTLIEYLLKLYCYGLLGRYANKENFTSAIKDFEEVLLLNPKHSNARNYLIETLLTVGRM